MIGNWNGLIRVRTCVRLTVSQTPCRFFHFLRLTISMLSYPAWPFLGLSLDTILIQNLHNCAWYNTRLCSHLLKLSWWPLSPTVLAHSTPLSWAFPMTISKPIARGWWMLFPVPYVSWRRAAPDDLSDFWSLSWAVGRPGIASSLSSMESFNGIQIRDPALRLFVRCMSVSKTSQPWLHLQRAATTLMSSNLPIRVLGST